jgi:hypothetical protein
MVIGLLATVFAAVAQVSVEVVLDQDQFLRDEALPVKVRVTNRSGQAIELGKDNEWLSFAVESLEGKVVNKLSAPDVTGEFKLESARVATRQVDLEPSYDLGEPGRYSVTATVKIRAWNEEVSSVPRPFQIVRGTKLWEQEFGVPGTTGTPDARKYILQQANYQKSLKLYLRVADMSDNVVYRVFPLGQLVSFSQPEAQIDKSSCLHVLFQTGARSFLFQVVSPDGNLVLRQTFDYADRRPALRADAEGRVFVAGGLRRLAASDLPPSSTSDPSAPRSSPVLPAAETNSPADGRNQNDGKTRKK